MQTCTRTDEFIISYIFFVYCKCESLLPKPLHVAPLPSDLTVVETVIAVVVSTVVALVVTATGATVVKVVVTATGGTVVAVVVTATGDSSGNQCVIELTLTLSKSVYTAKGCYWCSYMYRTISL